MLISGYKCDVCNAVKTEKNHWFMGWVSAGVDGLVVAFMPWEKRSADTKDHLCGLECLAKWIDRRAREISQ